MRRKKLPRNYKQKFMVSMIGFCVGTIGMMVLPLISTETGAQQLYQIVAGNKAYGCYESTQEAAKDLSEVRKSLEKKNKNSGPVMTEITCSIQPVKGVAKTST